jgi:hypothetical protein
MIHPALAVLAKKNPPALFHAMLINPVYGVAQVNIVALVNGIAFLREPIKSQKTKEEYVDKPFHKSYSNLRLI